MKYTYRAMSQTKNDRNRFTELGERSIWIFGSCIFHDFAWFPYSKWLPFTIGKSSKTKKKTTSENSNRAFSELRGPISIIFCLWHSSIRVLYAYQILRQSDDSGKNDTPKRSRLQPSRWVSSNRLHMHITIYTDTVLLRFPKKLEIFVYFYVFRTISEKTPY